MDTREVKRGCVKWIQLAFDISESFKCGDELSELLKQCSYYYLLKKAPYL
jgi:hypothetical protein